MDIKIIGCGHIGAINAYCLARMGNSISISEISEDKLNQLRSGEPLFYEKDLDWDFFYESTTLAKKSTPYEISVICIDAKVVEGRYQLEPLVEVVREELENQKIVLIRTTLGGEGVHAIREMLGDCILARENVYYWPEFMREGCAINDFLIDTHFIAPLFQNGKSAPDIGVSGQIKSVDCAITLAFVKMYSNAFRALKLTFANTVASSTADFKISHQLFNQVFSELRGNCDNTYLKPGDPFGGFCLPKETDTAAKLASSNGVVGECNIFSGVNKFNEQLIERMAIHIENSGITEICFLGYEFKRGTSDTRNSPYLRLANCLISKGLSVSLLDKGISTTKNIFVRDFDKINETDFKNVYRFLDLY